MVTAEAACTEKRNINVAITNHRVDLMTTSVLWLGGAGLKDTTGCYGNDRLNHKGNPVSGQSFSNALRCLEKIFSVWWQYICRFRLWFSDCRELQDCRKMNANQRVNWVHERDWCLAGRSAHGLLYDKAIHAGIFSIEIHLRLLPAMVLIRSGSKLFSGYGHEDQIVEGK